jgi:type IV pilus biogenesis protein CpaD/CtpE
VALALLLSACAATNPDTDARFGQSVRATMASQVAQPAAVRNANPVNGLDGHAARAAQEHYERSFGKSEAVSAAPAGLVGTK